MRLSNKNLVFTQVYNIRDGWNILLWPLLVLTFDNDPLLLQQNANVAFYYPPLKYPHRAIDV